MLQQSRTLYIIPYISWLQLAAEYGGCSQLILTSPLSLVIAKSVNIFCSVKMETVLSLEI